MKCIKRGEKNKQFNICSICEKVFYNTHKTLGTPAFKKRKFCGMKCRIKSKIGFYKKGHESSYNKFGKEHCGWKGDNVGHSGLHWWIRRNWGSPHTCEYCDKTELSGSQIHWASINHTYTRDRKDWKRLCQSCHKLYDSEKVNFTT